MAESSLPITGGCLCGSIRFEAAALPVWVGYCHCRTCQKAYGAPFGLFAAFHESIFRYTMGRLKYYRSSAPAKRGFCSDCESPVDFKYVADSKIGVLIGTLDHPDQWPANRRHNGAENEMPWLVIDDGLPRVHIEK